MCTSTRTRPSIINIPRCQLVRNFVSILICYSILFQFAAVSIPYCFTALLFPFGILFTALHVQFAFRCFWLELVFCLSFTKTERVCFELICVFLKLAQSVTLMTCVREVPGSSLGLVKNILAVVFVVFRSRFRQMWNNCRLIFWIITQRVVVISYRCFETTYRSHLQSLKILDLLILRMEPIGCPKTPVINYHYSPRNNPEECSFQLLRGGSLKSRLQVRSQS